MFNRQIWDAPEVSRRNSSLTLSKSSLSRIAFSPKPAPTYEPRRVIYPSDGVYNITGAGVQAGGLHDCRALRLTCEDGDDKACEPNKCVYGTLQKTDLDLWKYTSDDQTIEVYYEPAPLIRLKQITRGVHNSTQVLKPASPPAYLSFFELADSDSETLYEIVYRNIAFISFKEKCNYNEACIHSNLASVDNIGLVYYGAITYLHDLKASEHWINYIKSEIKAMDVSAYTNSKALVRDLTLKLISYDKSFLQLAGSDLSYSTYELAPHSHPIYSRLPGVYKSDDEVLYTSDLSIRTRLDNSIDFGFKVAKGDVAYVYRPRRLTDPQVRDSVGLSPLHRDVLFTPRDPESWVKESATTDVSKYVLSGADSELYHSKTKIDKFYANILDPDTCYEQALDWTASLLGLIPPIWDSTWATQIKRAIIKNCLGWFAPEVETPAGPNIKGQVVSEFPFSGYTEYFDTTSNNFHDYDFSSITPRVFTTDSDNLVTLTPVDNLTINPEYWDGLYASKGTLIHLIWWNMLLGLERFSADDELESYESVAYKVTTYLPNQFKELNIPIKLSPCYAGIGAVCGLSRVYNISDFETRVLTCLPFRYSRHGKMWSTLENIYEYWTPALHKPRIQYGVFAAGYSAAEDTYLERSFDGTSYSRLHNNHLLNTTVTLGTI